MGSNPTRTQAIKRFLELKTHFDLSNLYTPDMECQVNVAQDGGQRVENDYQGVKWHGWTDGLTQWNSFRIPRNAATEPVYEDKEIRFDLAKHVEGIGMTGWDWRNKISRWVAYDFDSIVGHKQGLEINELRDIQAIASSIPWVTIRKSTSGNGIHLYVFVTPVKTKNHTEHQALGRAILGYLSAITGFDFDAKVDNCGGNMWVWHRKMTGEGLKLIKKGSVLQEIPPNWRDHIKVVSGKRRRALPQAIEESAYASDFEELCGQYPRISFDDDHKKLIEWLKENDAFWWYEQDLHILVTHTHYLKQAHEDLNLKGIFETLSPAQNLQEQNCFLTPIRKGAWCVRRYTRGVQEHASWDQDASGWTRCYFNREPDLATACKSKGGLEDPSGGFIFAEAEVAAQAALLLGVNLEIPTPLRSRSAKIKQHKDGRIVIEIDREDKDTIHNLAGWLPKKNLWTRIVNAYLSTPQEPEIGNYDDVLRHIVTETNEDCGWLLKTDGIWRQEPLNHVKLALNTMGLSPKEASSILGSSVLKCWKIVSKPFQPEYPGDRQWNRHAAQLRYTPSRDENLKYHTWTRILQHCGKGLDDTIARHDWCKANGILNGGDYLKCWIASLIQNPESPLPYIFFYGPQNSGKSIFHEALSLLFTKGYKRADTALISQGGFNAELEGSVLCVVEETDLRKNTQAYNRIKDWVTSLELLIHPKGKTPYHIKNTTHWIQCSNEMQACPVFTGDTRITMCYVSELEEVIPKAILLNSLEKEAPDFLGNISKLELPQPTDRLGIPCLHTNDKDLAQQYSKSSLELFLEEYCEYAPGYLIIFQEFHERFMAWIDADEAPHWGKIATGREIPAPYLKGRTTLNNQVAIGNIKWKDALPRTRRYGERFILNVGRLEIIPFKESQE